MSKVITFSRYFPSYHPRKGEPTFFVEKIHWGLIDLVHTKWLGCFEMLPDLNQHLPNKILQNFIHWFNKPLTGQIICWNENIEY